jgi:hypothetical protein
MRDLLGGPEFGQPKPVQSPFMSNHRDTRPRRNAASEGLSRYAACRDSIGFSSGDLRGNRHSIGLVFAQPQLETSFEYEDVTNRIVIDKGFNARPLHWLCGGVVENENRAARDFPKKALKLRDWHSEGIGNLQYIARSSARAQLNNEQIWFNRN